jgi:hypothetical protein
MVILEKLRRFCGRFWGLKLELDDAGVVESQMNFTWCRHVVVDPG